MPTATRRGLPTAPVSTSAWTSINNDRVPSRSTVTTLPEAGCGSRDKKIADGFLTSRRPCSAIANTPISFAAPNRFFTDRRMRKRLPVSLSKYSTVSTMCSSTRGPAICPSFVTWPTSSTAVPLRFAWRTSNAVHSRSCATDPGADSMPSV